MAIYRIQRIYSDDTDVMGVGAAGLAGTAGAMKLSEHKAYKKAEKEAEGKSKEAYDKIMKTVQEKAEKVNGLQGSIDNAAWYDKGKFSTGKTNREKKLQEQLMKEIEGHRAEAKKIKEGSKVISESVKKGISEKTKKVGLKGLGLAAAGTAAYAAYKHYNGKNK